MLFCYSNAFAFSSFPPFLSLPSSSCRLLLPFMLPLTPPSFFYSSFQFMYTKPLRMETYFAFISLLLLYFISFFIVAACRLFSTLSATKSTLSPSSTDVCLHTHTAIAFASIVFSLNRIPRQRCLPIRLLFSSNCMEAHVVVCRRKRFSGLTILYLVFHNSKMYS